MSRDTYDQKLERILREASIVFAEKGYHKASIRDIARATGLSLSGLYHYFSSKEELLFLIQRECLDTLLDGLTPELDGVEDPEARLRLLVRNHVHFFVSNMHEMKVLAREADSLTGRYREEATRQMKEYTGVAYEILDELAPEHGATDLRAAAFSLFGMMNWIHTWYDPERDVGPERLADHMLHVFLHGFLSSRSGRPDEGTRDAEPRSLRDRP